MNLLTSILIMTWVGVTIFILCSVIAFKELIQQKSIKSEMPTMKEKRPA